MSPSPNYSWITVSFEDNGENGKSTKFELMPTWIQFWSITHRVTWRDSQLVNWVILVEDSSLICDLLLTVNVWFTSNYSWTSIIDHLLYKATTSHRWLRIQNTLHSLITTVRTSHKQPPLTRNCDHVYGQWF